MQLDPTLHPWLANEAAARVFAQLPPGSTRFVGGCVRDALLGRAVADIDIATTCTPNEVASALKPAGIAIHKTGIAHGTLTAVSNESVFEITTLRRDVSTDGRRASVAFTTDWTEDARRRDFTVNALYAAPDGKIFDPLGTGIADLQAKKLRFAGDPANRIAEDYLRILRYFRFQAQLFPGAPMDKPSLDACRAHKDGMRQLSAERIWAEIKKILSAPDPNRVMRILADGGFLDIILPEASNADGLSLMRALEQEFEIPIDPYLRLMAIAARDELAMARLTRRLKLSNKEAARLKNWARGRTALSPGLSGKDRDIAIYKCGRQAAIDRATIRAAGADKDDRAGWLALARYAKDWDWPEFPLGGTDMSAAGIAPGPEMGKALAALKALWIRSGFRANKAILLAALPLLMRVKR